MKISFIVPGSPQGKARPRVCRVGGKSITYTPKKTVEYENKVRASYANASKVFFNKGIPLEVNILALFSIPKNTSKRFINAELNNELYPVKKPDADNVLKAILDALNGLAYYDDAQICRVYFEKRYAELPCVKVEIKAIKED